MELDELKYQLNKKLNADQPKSASELSLLLKKAATSVIQKLQRSLWIDMIINILVLILFVWQAVFNKLWSLRIYFSTFIILSVVALLVLIYLIKKIESLNSSVLPVKQNLEQVYKIINFYKVICFRLTMLFIPLCIFYAFLLGYIEGKNGTSVDYSILVQKAGPKIWIALLLLILYLGAVSVGVYYFTKWFLNRLYGKYLIKLKSLIEELNTD